ncbi:MAG TPA: hypothetical protein VHV78_09835 [Gemmatimonadaceae bacterium]|nr:hypothetical protein [Gemmatimonadaceae bacterium]
MLHFEHDLPSVMGTARVLERAARLSEREDPVDHNAQLTGVDAASQLRELLAVGLDDKVAGANLVLACQLRGRRLDQRHEGSAPDDHSKRPRKRVAASKVYHQVDRRNRLFKANGVAIEHVVGPQVANEFRIAGANRCRDVGAGIMRQLYDEHANAAGAAVDEHALPRTEPTVREQSLPGAQPRQRNGGGGQCVNRSRGRRQRARWHADELGSRAIAVEVDQAEHRFADREIVDALADRNNVAGHFVRWNGRRSRPA